MRIPALMTFLFVSSIGLYGMSVQADVPPSAAETQPETTRQNDEKAEEAVPESGKSENSYVELEAVITNKPIQPSEKPSPNADVSEEKVEEKSETTKEEVSSEEKPSVEKERGGDSAVKQGKGTQESMGTETEGVVIKDPIQSYNRAIFVFNDKAYYYFFKPVYRGYRKVVPEKARVSIRNFYTNIKTPVRLFNCLFQGKFKKAGTEGLRFLINSTVGVGGLFDPAKSQFHLKRHDEDTGQTLAKHKVKSGIYIVWPFLGPSTVRDTAGLAGDAALNPVTWVTYFFLAPIEGFGINAHDTVNDTSLEAGDTYEKITKPAVDPYIALLDAYIQNRNKKIRE